MALSNWRRAYMMWPSLSAPLFQVLYQMKLLTTAFVSVLILQRRYSISQWISLIFLTLGAIIAITANDDGSNGQDIYDVNSKYFIGILVVIIACFCSAFAGVIFEKLLKKGSDENEANQNPFYRRNPSMWMRNVQLGTFSFFFAILQFVYTLLSDQGGQNTGQPFLSGFSYLVWILVLLRATCGILVAVIIKNMDNVVKSIASSISVLVGCILSLFLFGTKLQGSFWVGAVIVVGSSFIFTQPCIDLKSFSLKAVVSSRHVNVGMLTFLTVSGIGSTLLLNNFSNHAVSNSTAISYPTMSFESHKIDSLPENFRDRLHFVVFVGGHYNPKGDCGGCTVLWELYFTLKALHFSASSSMNFTVSDRTIVGIYPEVSNSTTPGVDIHVRWILAAVGINIPASVAQSWRDTDLVFNYATSTGVNVPLSNLLQVVNAPSDGDETDVSNDLFFSKNRSGIAWMMRKGPSYHRNDQIVQIHNKTGYSITQLDGNTTISGLRKFEYFVTYDPYTFWTWFAAMQGTVSIVYPLVNVTKAEWAMGTFPGSYVQDQNIAEIPGVAYGWEDSEIDYARRTMHKVRPFFLSLRKWGAEVTVNRFARDCYRYSLGQIDKFEGALLKKDVYPN
jgi:UDP-galactose transporter